MGHVYAAEHQLLGRRAAIKVLDEKFDDDETIKSRFFNEARAISQLKHPSIVEIYDFGHAPDGRAYLVMEMLTGESLGRRMKRGVMPIEPTLVFARQIASALSVAHDHGIVHRDLKPDNVFIEADAEAPLGERAKVLDFGVAKHRRPATHDGGHLTQTGVLLGTPAYMSPEQVHGRQVTRHSDIYALGVMTYRMLTGQLPFDAPDRGDLLEMHIIAKPQPPTELNPEIPAALEATVLRCLAKRPSDRFDTMTDLATALGALLQLPGVETLGVQTDKIVRVEPETTGLPLPAPDTGPIPLDDPTTLRSSVGEHSYTVTRPGRRTWPLLIAAAAVLVGGATFALTRDAPRSTGAPKPAAAPDPVDDEPAVSASPTPPPSPAATPAPDAAPPPAPAPPPKRTGPVRTRTTPAAKPKPKPKRTKPKPPTPKRQDFEQPVY